MKLGTYTKLSCQLLGLTLLWSSAACGIRSTLLQEEDAGAVTEDQGAQSSSTSSGGRSGTTTTPRAGRSGSGAAGTGAAGTGGAGQATAGRAARAGRGGSGERGGAGGAGGKSDAAGSGDDKKDDEKTDEQQAGAGGEKAEQAGAGGEQAGAGGEQAGAGGEQAGAGGDASGVAGMDAAAGSGGTAGEPEQAGTGGAPERVPGSLSQLTPEEVTTLCSNIDMATVSLPWGDGIRGYCSRRGLAQPEMCSAVRDMCVDGPEITPVCAQTIPDCPNITITEYQRCRIDTLYRFIEDNRMITCETMPPLPGPSAIPSCDEIYDRCPAARALRVL